jgi:hypothetical protein
MDKICEFRRGPRNWTPGFPERSDDHDNQNTVNNSTENWNGTRRMTRTAMRTRTKLNWQQHRRVARRWHRLRDRHDLHSHRKGRWIVAWKRVRCVWSIFIIFTFTFRVWLMWKIHKSVTMLVRRNHIRTILNIWLKLFQVIIQLNWGCLGLSYFVRFQKWLLISAC